MLLKEFLLKDCCDNKQIQSCQQCLYEKECDQTHLKLIQKAVSQYLLTLRDDAPGFTNSGTWENVIDYLRAKVQNNPVEEQNPKSQLSKDNLSTCGVDQKKKE